VKPVALDALPESALVRLDVRADLSRGEEPFARIMTAVRALAPDQALVLRAPPFEPILLYRVLGKRGFSAWVEGRAPGDWVAWFHRESRPAPASIGATETVLEGPGDGTRLAGPAAIRIDVRGLEPPQPMVRILEALEALGAGAELRGHP
jgi:hypothetical protein